MPWIGIDAYEGSVYEGGYRHGHAVIPTPVTAPATIATAADLPPKLPLSHGAERAEILFREDSFDAVTRVRRGRLYFASQMRPEDWEVYPHPYRPTEVSEARPSGTITKPLFSFQALHVPSQLKEILGRGEQPLVAIGTEASFTIWTISSIEGSSTGEFLLTLRGRQTFGALPDLNVTAIPHACRRAVVDAVAKLREENFRASAGSIVDRARDAASATLSGYLQDIGVVGPGLELDALIKKLNGLEDRHRKRVAAAAAEIVRLFHSREKPSLQERLSVRPVHEQEAQLAVACVGSLLCELGWAAWS